MSIELDPVELGFRRPFNHEIEERLRLKNPNSTPVLFKVKTTAPKQYCVRPNCGRIEAGEAMEVAVLLQAMKEDPPLDAKCRDKFLVQSATISPEQEITNVAQEWSTIESSSKVNEKKIRVSFLPADGSTSVNHATPSRQSIANHDDQPPAYSSPLSNTGTPIAAASSSKAETNGSASRDVGNNSSISDVATGAGAGAAVGGAASGAVASSGLGSIPQSGEDVQAQLAEAKSKIADLQRQLQDPGLRQRKVDAVVQGTKEKVNAGATALQQGDVPNGVAVPIVAALCLLSFLIAWIFF